MRVAVLGPLEVDDGRILLAPRDQVVLEALAARPGELVRAEELAEALWGERWPTSWQKVVQGCVSRLRKALGSAAIVRSSNGYRLVLHRDDVDQMCFEDLLLHAGRYLADGEHERARYAGAKALRLWRGDPLERLGEWATGRIEAERLGGRHLDAEDLFAEASLRAGHADEVLGDLQRMVAQQPMRERRWALLALAQYVTGRQADALGTLQRARTTLIDELGLDPGAELVELEEAILRQDPSLVVVGTVTGRGSECPYPGLVAYGIDDAGSFFGRESDVETGLRHLDSVGTLAIVGASGSGKSSLARAGVAAALARDGRRVRVVTPGRHPGDLLATVSDHHDDVLVVDQCEEALSADVSAAELEAFLDALGRVMTAGGVLILTLRADRLGEASRYAEFAHLVERGLYLLGPMDTPALRRAIEGPARQAGLRLEPGLVDLLVREVQGAPGALPLMSHVLRQTWMRREGDTLTVAGYAATGGIREAVSQSAEALFRDLTPRQQELLRELMLRLVAPNDLGEPVRTRAPRRSVAPDQEHEAVIEDLVRARLLSSDGATVEIAHEALALAWPRLRSWLDDDVEGLRIMRHLAVAADSWEELGRPEGELYRGPRQAKAEQWRTQSGATLTPVERRFLDESAALAEADARATEERVRLERRSNRRLRLGLASVAAMLAVAIVTGVLALTSAQRARQQATAADARRLGSEALRGTDIDRSLLLAVAGAQLDDSPDTRSNLGTVLGRAPQLLDSTRSIVPYSISMSADGRTLAVGGVLTGVRLVDAATLEEKAINDDVPVRKVLFSPDGAHLFASVNPWTPTGIRRVDPVPLRVLDPVTGALDDTQLGGIPPGLTLHETFALSTEGRWLGAAFLQPKYTDNASHIMVWDLARMAAPTAAFTIPYLTDQLAISPDGRRIHVTGEDAVHTLDVTTGREVRSAPVSDVGLLAVTPDGRSVAVARGNDVVMLDPETLTERSVLKGEGAVGGDLVISRDGTTIAYAVESTLLVRPVASPDGAGTTFPTGSAAGPNAMAFATDMRTVYASMDDGLTLAWDLVGDRQVVRPLALPPRPGGAEVFWSRVAPDGRSVGYLVTDGNESWGVQFLDVESRTWTQASPFTPSPGLLAEIVWDRGSRHFATVWGDQSVRVWDPGTARLVSQYSVPKEHGVTSTVGFSGDGEHLVVGTDLGWLHTFGTTSGMSEGRPVHLGPDLPPDRAAPIFSVDVDRTGTAVLVSVGGVLHLVDLTAGTVRRTRDLGFQAEWYSRSPVDGSVAVGGSANDGKRVAVLDPATLAVRAGPTRSDAIGHLRYSRDGDTLIGYDSTVVNLTDASGMESRGSLRLGEGGLGGRFFAATSFTADEAQVLIVTEDGQAFVWDPDPAAAARAACRMAGRDLTHQEWATYLPGRSPHAICAG